MISQTRRNSPLGRTLSIIELPSLALKFLILDCPTESTLPVYLEEFKKYNVTHVVRCCQPTYATTQLKEQGIQVHDLPFKDGGVPPPQVIQEWLNIVDLEEQRGLETTIAVHCVAGLGRAPVLVAIALIELLNMQPLDVVEFIRRKRKGAFNKPQIVYLDNYKPTLRKKAFIRTSFISKFFFSTFGKKQQEPQQPAEQSQEEIAIPLSSCV